MPKKSKITLLIIIFILALTLRLFLLTIDPILWWDEAVYANLGKQLSEGNEYSLDHELWSDYLPANVTPYAYPNIGYRAPLLPVSLSALYFLQLDWFLLFFIPLIGALSTMLVFLLGKRLFSVRTGFFAAAIMSVFPMHVLMSAKIMTGVYMTFFMLLSFIAFWDGYVQNKNAQKLLFGVWMAFALLSRYTTLWFFPIFLLFIIIKDKSLKIFLDKYMWSSAIIFLGILSPFFYYSIQSYNSIFGSFIHGGLAATYWGGVQSWEYFVTNAFIFSSLIGVLFLCSLCYIFVRGKWKNKEVYFLLLIIFGFIGFALLMDHKEMRFLLPIIPSISLLCGLFLDRIKKFGFPLLMGLFLFTGFFGLVAYYDYTLPKNVEDECFLNAVDFLSAAPSSGIIYSDESAVVHFYTQKKTLFFSSYPRNFEIEYWLKSDDRQPHPDFTATIFSCGSSEIFIK